MGFLKRVVEAIAADASDVEEIPASPTKPLDHQLGLLERLPDIEFDTSFRGLDPTSVDRLLQSVVAHLPNLRAGLQHHKAHGTFPSDDQFTNSIAVLHSVTTAGLPSAMRGYDGEQVEKVVAAINDLPAHLGHTPN